MNFKASFLSLCNILSVNIRYRLCVEAVFHITDCQLPISTQRKPRLLVLLQKNYLHTCRNFVRKPNLEEFLRKLFEQYRIENCGEQC